MTDSNTKKRRRNSVVVQGSILGAAAIIVRLIGLLYRVPLTNVLTDEGAGYYSAAFGVYTLFLMLSSYGFPSAIARLVASYYAQGAFKEAHKIFKSALYLGLLLGVISSLLMYFLADTIASNYLLEPGASFAIRALAPALLFYSALAVFRGYFQGMNTMMPTAISQIAEQILNALFSFILGYIFVKESLELGAAGGTLGTGIGAAAGLCFIMVVYFAARNRVIHKKLQKDTSNFTDKGILHYWKLIVKTAIPIIIGSLILQFASVIDTRIFYGAMSYQEVPDKLASQYYGVYTMKVKLIIRVPITLAYALGAASLPSIAKYLAKKDYRQVENNIRTAIKTTMLILMPSAFGVFILSEPILRTLGFVQNIDLSATALKIGAIAIVFNGLFTVTIAILQGLGKLKAQAFICLIGFVLKILLDYLFLYGFKMQINGIVMADNLFTLGLSVMNIFAIVKTVKVQFDIKNAVIKPIIASTVMAVISLLSYKLFGTFITYIPIVTILSVIIAMITYIVVLIKLDTLEEQEILDYPKGTMILKLFKKVRLMS